MAELGRTFTKQALARVTEGVEGARLIGATLGGSALANVQAVIHELKTQIDTKLAADHASVTNTRTPTDASVTNAKVAAGAAIEETKLSLATDAAAATGSRRTLGTGATQALPGNHVSTTNARVPLGHNPTHAANGTDPLTPAQIGAIAATEKGANSGVATLDASGKLLDTQTNKTSITAINVVASQAAMLALVAEEGDVAIRSDENKTYALRALPATTLSNWELLRTPSDQVSSVFGRAGAVAAALNDYHANLIQFTPAGNIAATTVDGALKELDTEKVDTGDSRMTNARNPVALSVVDGSVSATAAIAESKLALASDAAAGTASRRTLGTGALQAAAGNHQHTHTEMMPFAFSGDALPRVSNPWTSLGARTLHRVAIAAEVAPAGSGCTVEVRVGGVTVAGGTLTLPAGATTFVSGNLNVAVADLAIVTVAITNGGATPAQKLTVTLETGKPVA